MIVISLLPPPLPSYGAFMVQLSRFRVPPLLGANGDTHGHLIRLPLLSSCTEDYSTFPSSAFSRLGSVKSLVNPNPMHRREKSNDLLSIIF